jgi:hypothetical protein
MPRIDSAGIDVTYGNNEPGKKKEVGWEASRTFLPTSYPGYGFPKGVVSARDAMIGWTPVDGEDFDEHFQSLGKGSPPTAGQVEVGPFPEKYDNGWSERYERTWGACWHSWSDLPEVELIASVMVLFNTLTVRDVLAPLVVHKAFLKMKEYRETISPDSPGDKPGTFIDPENAGSII